MAEKVFPFPVYEFRPLPGFFAGEFRRYDEGRFTPDDGSTYDLAFVGRRASKGGLLGYPCVLMVDLPYREFIRWMWRSPMGWMLEDPLHAGPNRGNRNPWHYNLLAGAVNMGADWDRHRHPNTIAGDQSMSWNASRQGASNGDHVDFELRDPHIAAGLVRVRGGDLVVAPEKPECLYCGLKWWERDHAEQLHA